MKDKNKINYNQCNGIEIGALRIVRNYFPRRMSSEIGKNGTGSNRNRFLTAAIFECKLNENLF